MKIAIIGAISPNLSFRSWTNLINRHIDISTLRGIIITDGDNLLNTYSEKLAHSCSIPIERYSSDSQTPSEIAKTIRNQRLIEESDLVLALIKSAPVAELRCDYSNVHVGLSKKAILITTDIGDTITKNLEDCASDVTSLPIIHS